MFVSIRGVIVCVHFGEVGFWRRTWRVGSAGKICERYPLAEGPSSAKDAGKSSIEERFCLSVLQESVCVLLAERYRLKLDVIAAAPQAREPRTLLRVAQPQEHLPLMPRLVFSLVPMNGVRWRQPS